MDTLKCKLSILSLMVKKEKTHTNCLQEIIYDLITEQRHHKDSITVNLLSCIWHHSTMLPHPNSIFQTAYSRQNLSRDSQKTISNDKRSG